MMMHPMVFLTMATDHHRELIADAEKHHLLTIAREARKARKARKNEVVRGHPAGNLASCEPSAVVPAR
jgi:hypothetical protein